ncbi:MAG: hypothetical protein H7174_13890 [Flavobacterium sp.]|nr:hypothetical protein [Flavobacterium sp.]
MVLRKLESTLNQKGKGSRGKGGIVTFETIVNINETKLLFASIYNKGDFNSFDIAVLKRNLGIE